MENSKQRKKGAILSYVSIFVNTIIQLIYTPFLIKMLGQSEYGLYSLVSSIIGYLAILDLGFGNAIIIYTSKYRATNDNDAEKKLHGMFKVVFYIIGLMAMLLGVILYLNIATIFDSAMTSIEIHKTKIMMLILTFNLGMSFIFSIYTSIINAYEKFVFQKVIAIIGTILKPAIMIPLLLVGMKSITMTIVITIVNVGIMLANYIYCRRVLNVNIKYNGFDKQLFKTVFGYSIWLFIGTIVDKVNWSVDNFVLGAVSGTVAVSIYSVAATLNHLFINLSTAISSVLLPKISKMVAKNAKPSELTAEFIKVGRLQYYVIFLMCSGLIMFGKQFINIWVGPAFNESYYVALILIIPLCLPLIQNLGISIMQAKNMYKFRSIILFCIAIANVIISIPLAKVYGSIGSAIGTSISLLVGNVLIINIYYYKKVGINILKFWREILKMTVQFLIPVVLIIIFMNVVAFNGYLKIFICGGIYSIIYILISYILIMDKYEKNIVDKVIRKFIKKRGA